MLKLETLNSFARVRPEGFDEAYVVKEVSAFRNEPVSFQIAYRSPKDIKAFGFSTVIDTDLDISFFSVGNVPLIHTDTENLEDTPSVGLMPDMLLPKKVNAEIVHADYPWTFFHFEKGEKYLTTAVNDSWQSLWITVNENQKDMTPGDHKISFKFISRGKGAVMGEISINVKIFDAKLPPQKLIYTNWFHLDCLSDFYCEPMFTDRFFDIVYDYAKKASLNGMNMILLPAFTPPLDTPIGKERKTTQLVKIAVNDGKYSFDFSIMKRYMDVCRKAGIKYFEHSHLFTQWGATSTPKIVANVNGKEKHIFGWHVKADSKKYRDFLDAYLPALKEFLKAEKLDKKILFHISDEPDLGMMPRYEKAVGFVKKHLAGCMLGDALSHYEYYEKGLVQTPIVCTNHVADFVGRCKNLWAYYTGGQVNDGLSNRILVNSAERNRILGIQMYYHNVKGFLHWGYNYYYDVLCHGLFDPKMNACGYNGHSGTSYFVYPSHDGTAIQSTRQKVFFEGINDYRALQLLEKKCGRKCAEDLVKKHFGDITFYTKPSSPTQILEFRAELNRMVVENN